MIVGCYSMHLYCEQEQCPANGALRGVYTPTEFSGRTRAECTREARRDGWLVNHKANKCWCKEHRPKRGSKS